MKAEYLAEAIGGIDDDLVTAAMEYTPRAAKGTGIKWAALAACLALILAVGAAAGRFSARIPERGTEAAQKYIDVYYVTEDGTLESSEVFVRCTAGDVFACWAELSGITDVSLADCRLEGGAVITERGDPSGAVEYCGGKSTLILTLSPEFSAHANSEALTESLRLTFASYVAFDEFELVVLE